MRFALLTLALLAACRTNDKVPDGDANLDTGAAALADGDGDGFAADEDCDDDDASVNSGATEVCDGIDNDCDGEVDEGVTSTWYADADGDSYGDADAPEEACSQPADTVSNGSDCDDTDADIHPAAGERCNGVDDDCDGAIDEDLVEVWYADADGDGFGDPDSGVEDCDPADGLVEDGTDCDDTSAAVNPDAAEVCNGIDDDCDSLVDDADSDLDTSTADTWYADGDGDGYGDAGAATTACVMPSGTVADATDCDDVDFAVNPAATEICNGVDDDCDALVDDADPSVDASAGGTWYADSDADGYGDAGASVAACSQPSGTVSDDSDCDDSAAAVNPGASEVCNGVDDDCDALVDDADPSLDAGTTSTWYADSDSDGYGDASSSTAACSQPSGTVSDDSDCDDSLASVNPGASEVCNSRDDDCDGLVDDDDSSVDTSTGSTWYADSDSDGYGDASSSTDACSQPSGTVSDASDCDDGDGAVNPGATEACNGVDDDCSGSLSWLEDDGDADGLLACEEAVWLRTDGEANNDATGTGTYGSSQAAALLTSAGFTWDTARLSTDGVSASWLDHIGLLVVVGRGTDGALSSAQAQALGDWVDDGGSVLFTGYHPDTDSCAMVDSLPSSFGLACASSTYSNYWTGPVTTITSHPVTSGVSSIGGAGGERWTASGSTTTLASTGGSPVVVVASPGDGRLVGVSDEWFLYNAGAGSADLSQEDNQTLVENAFDWLGDLPL